MYINRVYSSATDSVKKDNFLTLKVPKNYNIDLNFDLITRSSFGQAVFNFTLNIITGLFVRCLNGEVSKNFYIVADVTSDANYKYYYIYCNNGAVSTIFFSFENVNGTFKDNNNVDLSTKLLLSTGIFIPNEGTVGQQSAYATGTNIPVNGITGANTSMFKLGNMYMWENGGHIRYSTTYPANQATDGTQLV